GPTRWGLPSALIILLLLFYEKLNGMPHLPFLYFLGNISFSLYLSHVIIIKVIKKYGLNFGLEGLPAFIYAVAISLGVVALVYHMVELRSIKAFLTLIKRVAARDKQPVKIKAEPA